MLTLTNPGEEGGVVTVRLAGLVTLTRDVCTEPKFTLAPTSKLVPAIVTVWPRWSNR